MNNFCQHLFSRQLDRSPCKIRGWRKLRKQKWSMQVRGTIPNSIWSKSRETVWKQRTPNRPRLSSARRDISHQYNRTEWVYEGTNNIPSWGENCVVEDAPVRIRETVHFRIHRSTDAWINAGHPNSPVFSRKAKLTEWTSISSKLIIQSEQIGGNFIMTAKVTQVCKGLPDPAHKIYLKSEWCSKCTSGATYP